MSDVRNANGETWDGFIARRLDEEGESESRAVADSRGNQLPASWEEKPRKRAAGPPPDFDAQEEAVETYATLHGRMWQPEVVDLKRAEDGGVAYLLKDRREDYLMLVLQGLDVVEVGTREAFLDREEVLT